MGVSVGGKIATDGLMIHLDALNPASYPNTGNDWYSLRPSSSYALNLAAGTTPAAIANGYAAFDPANESQAYIDGVALDKYTPYVTIDFWAKLKPFVGTGIRRILSIASSFYVGYLQDVSVGIGTNTTDLYGIDGLVVESLGGYNKWAHFSCVLANGVDNPGYPNRPQSDQKTYINGVLEASSPQTGGGTDYPNQRSWGSTGFVQFYIGGPRGGTWGNFDIALVKVYNRELTQAEVTQNFNAHKGRFNIY